MQDRTKGCLSGIFFSFAFILPFVGLIIGWVGWEWKTGIIVALATFALFFVLGGIFAVFIRVPSWIQILSPFIVGITYSVLNPIPLPFDDTVVASVGAILSYTLALKRYTDAPKWIIVPLLTSALYTIVGDFIPGPVDELLVGIIATATATIATAMSRSLPAPPSGLPSGEEES